MIPYEFAHLGTLLLETQLVRFDRKAKVSIWVLFHMFGGDVCNVSEKNVRGSGDCLELDVD